MTRAHITYSDASLAQPETGGAVSTRNAYSVAALAEKWGVSTGYIYKLVKAKRLRPFTPPPLIRITVSEVERFESGEECASSSTGESGRLSGATAEQLKDYRLEQRTGRLRSALSRTSGERR